jgi:hypothetical protein
MRLISEFGVLALVERLLGIPWRGRGDDSLAKRDYARLSRRF